MSRSYRKAIYKDRGYMKSIYWGVIRSVWRNWIKSGRDPEDLPNKRSIVNDWNYSDYCWKPEFNEEGYWFTKEYIEKLKRK